MTGEQWYYVCDKCGNIVTIEAAPLKDHGAWMCDRCGASALWEFANGEKAKQHGLDIHMRWSREQLS